MKLNFLIFISLNTLKINVNLFLFKMSFEKFILKLFSFDLFLIINLRSRIITINKIIDKNERFFDVNILLSSLSFKNK